MILQPHHHTLPFAIIEFREHERWLCHSLHDEGAEFLHIHDLVQGNPLAGRHREGYPVERFDHYDHFLV